MTTAVPTLHDRLAYRGKPFVQTHPGRLSAVARLFGLKTQDAASCRMLEIGCGDGSNLIAMASALPSAEFLGIDLSETAINRGKSLARQTGLKNVSLIATDLCDFDDGEFDYIAAHGVYSWVPSHVRDRLMQICAQRLLPTGIAMISYATYPGGFIEQWMRAPLLFQAGRAQSIEAARAFADLVGKQSPSRALRDLYQEEWNKIASHDDSLLLHDQLEEAYTPVYFTDFIRHAKTNGLQYLAEANPGETYLGDPENDRIAAEQVQDFLKCRRFRQTILCRAALSEEDTRVSNQPDASALRECYASAPPYFGWNTGLPQLEAAWPGFLPCDAFDTQTLLRLFAAGRIDVRTTPAALDNGSSARPRATALARAQAASGNPITNLLHHEVIVEDNFTRTLLTLLDGRRTRHDLVIEIARRSSSPAEKVELEITRIIKMLGHHALLHAAN